MQIAFYIRHKGFYEWLIRKFTGSPTHCELVFSTGEWFSASSREGGTRFKRMKPNANNWIFIDVSDLDEEVVYKYCKSIEGKPYDFLGALLGWARIDAGDKWFCSEACTRALQSSGFHKELSPCTITPSKLYELGRHYVA